MGHVQKDDQSFGVTGAGFQLIPIVISEWKLQRKQDSYWGNERILSVPDDANEIAAATDDDDEMMMIIIIMMMISGTTCRDCGFRILLDACTKNHSMSSRESRRAHGLRLMDYSKKYCQFSATLIVAWY